jgi:hypothetical protein
MRTKVFVVTAAAVAMLMGPVSAADAVPVPGFVCAAAPAGGNLTVCIKGVAVVVPVGSARAVVAITCEAFVQGVVATTGVGCQLNALAGGAYGNAPNRFLPGSATETELVLTSVPLQPYEICVGGTYSSLTGAEGNPNNWSVTGCFSSV